MARALLLTPPATPETTREAVPGPLPAARPGDLAVAVQPLSETGAAASTLPPPLPSLEDAARMAVLRGGALSPLAEPLSLDDAARMEVIRGGGQPPPLPPLPVGEPIIGPEPPPTPRNLKEHIGLLESEINAPQVPIHGVPVGGALFGRPYTFVQMDPPQRREFVRGVKGMRITGLAGEGLRRGVFLDLPRKIAGIYGRTGLPGSEEAAEVHRDLTAQREALGPAASVFDDPGAALADPGWWAEVGGEIAGWMLGPQRVVRGLGSLIGAKAPPTLANLAAVKGLGPTLKTLFSGAGRRALPFAGVLGLSGAAGTAADPESSATDVLESFGTSAAMGALFSLTLDALRYPAMRVRYSGSGERIAAWLQERSEERLTSEMVRAWQAAARGDRRAVRRWAKAVTRYEARHGPIRLPLGKGPKPGEGAFVKGARQNAQARLFEAAARVEHGEAGSERAFLDALREYVKVGGQVDFPLYDLLQVIHAAQPLPPARGLGMGEVGAMQLPSREAFVERVGKLAGMSEKVAGVLYGAIKAHGGDVLTAAAAVGIERAAAQAIADAMAAETPPAAPEAAGEGQAPPAAAGKERWDTGLFGQETAKWGKTPDLGIGEITPKEAAVEGEEAGPWGITRHDRQAAERMLGMGPPPDAVVYGVKLWLRGSDLPKRSTGFQPGQWRDVKWGFRQADSHATTLDREMREANAGKSLTLKPQMAFLPGAGGAEVPEVPEALSEAEVTAGMEAMQKPGAFEKGVSRADIERELEKRPPAAPAPAEPPLQGEMVGEVKARPLPEGSTFGIQGVPWRKGFEVTFYPPGSKLPNRTGVFTTTLEDARTAIKEMKAGTPPAQVSVATIAGHAELTRPDAEDVYQEVVASLNFSKERGHSAEQALEEYRQSSDKDIPTLTDAEFRKVWALSLTRAVTPPDVAGLLSAAAEPPAAAPEALTAPVAPSGVSEAAEGPPTAPAPPAATLQTTEGGIRAAPGAPGVPEAPAGAEAGVPAPEVPSKQVAAAAGEPAAPRAVFLRSEEGPFGDLWYYRLEAPGHPKHGEEVEFEGVPEEFERVGEPEEPEAVAPAPEPGPALTRESQRVAGYLDQLTVGQLGQAAKWMSEPGKPAVASVPKVKDALKAARRAGKHQRDVEKRALDLGLEKYEAEIEGEGVATTPILHWLPYKIPVAEGTEHSAEIMEALEGRPHARKYFAVGVRVGGGIDELADMAIDAPDSGFKGRSVSDFLDAVIAEADAATVLRPARGDFADRLRTAAAGIPESEGRPLEELADVWERALEAEETARQAVVKVMRPFVTTEVVEATKLAERLRGMTERAEKAEAEAAERAGELKREQERAARARKALRGAEKTVATLQEASVKLHEAQRELGIVGEQTRLGKEAVPELVRAVKALLDRAPLPEAAGEKIFPLLEKVATPAQMRRVTRAVDRAVERELKAKLQQRIQVAAEGIWTHREEFDRRLPENRNLLKKANSSRRFGKKRAQDTSIDELSGLAEHLESGLFQHQTREKMLASLQEDKVNEVASGIVSGLPPRRLLSAGAPGEQPRAPVERRARRVLAHTLKPGRLIRRYVGKPESPGYQVLYQAPVVEGGHDYCVEMNGLDDAWSSMVKEATGTEADSPKFGDWLFEVVRAPGCPPMERRVLATLLGQMRDPHSRAFEPRTGFNLHTDLSGPVHRLALKDVSVLEAWVKKNDPALSKLVKALHDYYNRPEHLEKLSATSKQLSGREVQRVKSWWYSPRNVTKHVQLRPTETPRDLARQSTAGHMRGRVPRPRSPLILHPVDSIFFRLGNADAGFLAYALPLRDANEVLNFRVPVRPGQDLPLYRYLERKLGKSVVREAQGNLASIYKSLGMMMGVNARTYSLAARWARKQMLRMGKAITWINPRMLGRQVVGTFVSWSDPKAPPAKYWRRAAREVFTHPLRAIWEVRSKVPEVKYRHEGGGLIYNYISGGTADPRVLLSSRKAIRHMQIVGEKHGPMMLKIGDALGQAVRYRASYGFLRDKGLRGKELETEAAKLTVHLMTEWDFPSTFGNLSGLERAARESIFMRGLTWFRITRGNVFCGFLEILDDVADAHRTGGDMRPLLKRLTKWLIAAIAMAGLSAVYGLSRRKTRSVAGFSEEAAWGIADSSLGHIPAAGKLVSTVKWSRPGGPQIETAPFMRPVEDTLGGMMSLFAAIDKADPDRAYRATIRMSSALALMLGVPIVGPRNVWRVIFPTGKRPSERAAKEQVALIWKASGTGARAAEAAAELKEGGATLAATRVALRKMMREERLPAEERDERLRRLTERWRGGATRFAGSRTMARSSGPQAPSQGPRRPFSPSMPRLSFRSGVR